MKQFRGIITSLILLLGSLLQAQQPEFRLKDLENQWKGYDDVKGTQLTIIDFWATWCQPCIRFIPLLNEMAEELSDQGVQFVGVSVDGPRNQSKISPFIRSLGVTYPILRDIDSELMSELGVTAVPTLIIFDSDGKQVFYHEGFRPGDETLILQQIKQYLDE